MLNFIRQFVREEEGAAAAEYAILLMLITVALVAVIAPFSTAISNVFTSATGALTPVAS
jgi:Flp pilus assembly pilin Flp